jgi:phosphocarrier protein
MSYSLQETVTLKNKLGLHARAAAVFVQVASKYQSHIKLKKPNNSGWVNGKSILSVMTLDASMGSQIIINVEGDDAQEALNRLIKLVNDKFGEKE